jgi:serine/threonine protein kinase
MVDPISANDPTISATENTGATTSRGKFPPRYRISGPLGAGGMGEVLLATDSQIDREVAIKRMLHEPTGPAVARFLREAKVQGRLDHPAIVPVHELANDSEGRPFFVMKRLVGTTLGDVLARYTSDPRYTRQKLLRAFADVCRAIELAHSRNVIHRDLKPANIMLGDYGEVYVLDWGIARVLGETDPILAAATAGAQTELTQVGAILGTPGFIAPELVRGEPLETGADIFALGCILFEILAGMPLVPRGSVAAVLDDFESQPSVRAPDRDIAPELAAIVVGACGPLAYRPTARALADQIERFLDGDRDLAHRTQLAATHLAAARAAAESDSPSARSLAMREAGRALALDPASGAADLLGRLMLQPPKDLPPEVRQRFTVLDEQSGRMKAKMFWPTYATSLLMLPLLMWLGLHSARGVGVYIMVNALNLVSCIFILARKKTTALEMYMSLVLNGFIIFIAALTFTPVLIAPGVAIVTVMMFSSDLRLKLSKVIGLGFVALLLPFVCEEIVAGWPTRISTIDGDLRAHSDYFTITSTLGIITFVCFVMLLIFVSAISTRRLAVAGRKALEVAELQAWHLRQLVR